MTPLTLGIDFETSGLVRQNLPLDDPSQPKIVEISARLVDGERQVAGFDCIIRPDGWSIEPEAEKVHGISEAYAYRHGIGLPAALIMLQAMTERARLIVAHNVEFERKMIAAELARLKANGRWWHSRAQDLRCTMMLSAPILKLPGDFGEYRWPSLEAAMAHFYPEMGWTTAHRSGSDVDACLLVWKAIQREHGNGG